MTNNQEINRLVYRMTRLGAAVTWTGSIDENGYECRDAFLVKNAKGIGPHPMGPIGFAERAREWLAKHERAA